MKNLLKALLFAGLFISNTAFSAISIGGVDYLAGTRTPTTATVAKCRTQMSSAEGSIDQTFFVTPEASNSTACTKGAKTRFMSTIMAWHNAGRACASQIISQTATSWVIQEYYVYPGTGACAKTGSGKAMGASATFLGLEETKKCPPDPSGVPFEDAVKSKYTLLLNGINEDGTPGVEQQCFKPLDPLDCSKLGGTSVTGQDYFITSNAGYSHPSCVTKCGTDSKGQRQCGNCKVAAKSWTQIAITTDGSIRKWSPLVGTFTGSSCAETEQDEQPPNQEKCWVSRNGLKMCQQDPAEKCVTINGVQQCESGCGYVNGDFFCKEGQEPTNPPDEDDPLPEVDDTIENPDKPLADMVKGDFKDVQRGVERRLAVVSSGIGNLENSVDTGNQILGEIAENTETALADNQTQIGLLGDIKDALSGNGECDPATDPDCTPPPCDPSKDDCEGFEPGSPKSWWNSKYPDGLTSLFAEKKAAFVASDAYQAMTGEGIADGGGGVTQWNICLGFGFADYGCHSLEISAAIWGFIRACILFGAAILCRRMLIGA